MHLLHAGEAPEAFKGREHVIPQGFGMFQPRNLVLSCVCDECNGYFGQTLDEKFASDSAEGFDRIKLGLKDARKYRSQGERSTSYVEFKEGLIAGRTGYFVKSQDAPDVLGMMSFPHITFTIEGSDREPLVFAPTDCPTSDELRTVHGVERGTMINIQSREVDDFFELLESKGFNTATLERGISPPPVGRVYSETVTLIAEPEYRMATKIALNYIAAVIGHDTARHAAFDTARQYARYGSERAKVRVIPYQNPWFLGEKGHYISVRRNGGEVIAQLSILMRTQYFVCLSTSAEGAHFLSTAHRFDLEDRRIKEIEPLPHMRGPELPKPSPRKP